MAIGSFEDVIENSKNGETDFTLSGECSNCGQCCSNFIPVFDSEIKRIKRYIKEHKIKVQVRAYPTATVLIDMMCPFRDEITKKCTIYEARPQICRVYKCNKTRNEVAIEMMQYYGKLHRVNMRETFYGK